MTLQLVCQKNHAKITFLGQEKTLAFDERPKLDRDVGRRTAAVQDAPDMADQNVALIIAQYFSVSVAKVLAS